MAATCTECLWFVPHDDQEEGRKAVAGIAEKATTVLITETTLSGEPLTGEIKEFYPKMLGFAASPGEYGRRTCESKFLGRFSSSAFGSSTCKHPELYKPKSG